MLARSCEIRLLQGRFAVVGAPAALLVAVVVSAAVTAAALLRARRERGGLLEASRPAAEALSAALGLPPPRPCALPWREGLWQIDGIVDDCVVRLLVGQVGVEVSFAVPGAAGLDLARDEDFGRGGIASPPEDPYRRLPDEVAGPGWWVRGVDGLRRVQGLPRPLLAALRQAPAGRRISLVDGRAATFVAAADATAASVRALVRTLQA